MSDVTEKENDATIPADDRRDKNANADETPKSPVANRVKIRLDTGE